MTLQAVPTGHDLPPAWDGVPISWGDWSTTRTTLALHLSDTALACDQCGTVDEAQISFGTRPPEPGATLPTTRTKTTKSGRQYSVVVEEPARPLKDLTAHRCRHCGHDQVTDHRTGETWDLDPDDYTDAGSTPTDTLF